jgi:hypothetical protein
MGQVYGSILQGRNMPSGATMFFDDLSMLEIVTYLLNLGEDSLLLKNYL